MVEERDKLLETTRKQSSDIESDAKRRSELETELAHAWDELNKMKAVDVRMHRSRVAKSVGKPVQSAQRAPEKKSDKVTKTPQNKQYIPAKDQEFYPYMIQVSSYKSKEDSMREAMILRDKGDSVCISHVRIAGKGDWYRVLVGFYRTSEEAKQAVLELKKREYNHAFVVRPPFTVELGMFSDNEKLKKLKAHLISKGYSAYGLPDREAKNEIRLLVGAFWTEKEAAMVTKDLLKEGFTPKVVRR
jgi:cell division septation protein DedD